MNQSQRKFLKERIERAEGLHVKFLYADGKMPANVAKAKDLYDAWQAEDRKRRSIVREKMRAAHSAVLECLFFGDPEAALKAVKKFESMKFPIK